MSVFSSAKITYLQSQRLAQIATAGPEGQPHVVRLAFRYNPETDTIDVGGHNFAKRKKYRDVQRDPHVAIVIDDLASVDPWRPRWPELIASANQPHEDDGVPVSGIEAALQQQVMESG